MLIRRRTNPWPAFVELFSALLTATFAGFIMMTGAYQQELSSFQQRELERKKFREHSLDIKNKVQQVLSTNSSIEAHPRSCGDDTCIDLYVHFGLNNDEIASDLELKSLAKACQDIKSALDTLQENERKDLGLVIEGHTDSKPAVNVSDPRSRERYNWDLSARRATSVLYEFRKCGLKAPEYQIVAIGYSDTMPVADCKEAPEKCDDKNRRTTLRLHADTAQIEERLRRMGR